MSTIWEPIIGWCGIVIGACGLVVACAAFYLAVTESRRGDDFNRKSLQPLLALDRSLGTEGFQLKRANIGNGPAKIKWMAVVIDGQLVNDWDEFLARLGAGKERYNFTMLWPEGWVRSGDSYVDLLKVTSPANASALFKSVGRYSVQICYCSMFGDCEVAALSQLAAIDTCESGRIYQAKFSLPKSM